MSQRDEPAKRRLQRLASLKRLGRSSLAPWRHRAYEILEHGPVGDRTMRSVSRALILLVFWRRTGLTFRPDFRCTQLPRGLGPGVSQILGRHPPLDPHAGPAIFCVDRANQNARWQR